MRSARLVRIVTPFVTVEIRGPRQPRSQVNREGLDRTPFFKVSCSTAAFTVQDGFEGGWRPPSDDFEAPAFFEDSQYKIRVTSLVPGTVPRAVHRDPLLFQSLDAYEDDDSLSGPFTFMRQVGLCSFAVHVGPEILSITIEVFPTKLDYSNDYDRLLVDISSASRALALEYMRTTFRSSARADVLDGSDLDWLIILRSEVALIERSVRYINAHPHGSLSRGVKYSRVEKARAHDTMARRSIISQSGIGPWTEIPTIGVSRAVVQGSAPLETLDTPEHRWLRLSLRNIGQRLGAIEEELHQRIKDSVRRNKAVSPRLAAERNEVSDMVQTIQDILGLPIFIGITLPPPAGFSSLRMHAAAGYGDVYRSLMVLKQGLEVSSPGDNHHSVSDVHELYEAWSYIEVVRIVLKITGSKSDLSQLLKTDGSGVRVQLQRGKRSTVSFDHGQGKLDIIYNMTYRGLTGSQKPDIVLVFRRQDWPDLVVVLDAKYRVDASPEMLDRFDMPAPPADAINALHRYRDAITLPTSKGTRTRPVVKGAALFPLNAEDSSSFAESRISEALLTLGIGAIPFLPNNTGHVEAWLRSLLAMAPKELSEPGPPFSGVEHLRNQAQVEAAAD